MQLTNTDLTNIQAAYFPKFDKKFEFIQLMIEVLIDLGLVISPKLKPSVIVQPSSKIKDIRLDKEECSI